MSEMNTIGQSLANFFAQSIQVETPSNAKRNAEYNEDAITVRISRRKDTPSANFRIGKNLIQKYSLISKNGIDFSIAIPVLDSEGNHVDGKHYLTLAVIDNTVDKQPMFGKSTMATKREEYQDEEGNTRFRKVPAEVSELIEEGKEFSIKSDPMFEYLCGIYPQMKDADRVEITMGNEVLMEDGSKLPAFISATPNLKTPIKQRTPEEFSQVFLAEFEFFGLSEEQPVVSMEEALSEDPISVMEESDTSTEDTEDTEVDEALSNAPATQEEKAEAEMLSDVADEDEIDW